MSQNKEEQVILEIDRLCKDYGKHKVLKGITTTIKKGEVIAIIGPSGCGKSTFLRSLNLLETPTSGTICFEGTNITDPSVDINRMREKIGMVFQQFHLFSNMTIKKNIMLAPVKKKKMKNCPVTGGLILAVRYGNRYRARNGIICICFTKSSRI